MTREKLGKICKGVIPVKLILWATNILKLPSADRPARKKIKDIKLTFSI